MVFLSQISPIIKDMEAEFRSMSVNSRMFTLIVCHTDMWYYCLLKLPPFTFHTNWSIEIDLRGFKLCITRERTWSVLPHTDQFIKCSMHNISESVTSIDYLRSLPGAYAFTSCWFNTGTIGYAVNENNTITPDIIILKAKTPYYKQDCWQLLSTF